MEVSALFELILFFNTEDKFICSLLFSPQLTFLSLLLSSLTIPLNPFILYLLSPFGHPISYHLLLCFSDSHLSHFLQTAVSPFVTSLFLLFSFLSFPSLYPWISSFPFLFPFSGDLFPIGASIPVRQLPDEA